MSCLTSWRLCGALIQSRPPITNNSDNAAYSWVLSNSFAVVVLYLTGVQGSANPYRLYLKDYKVRSHTLVRMMMAHTTKALVMFCPFRASSSVQSFFVALRLTG